MSGPWPPAWPRCQAIRSATFPGLRLSIYQSDFEYMTRNQETNGFRRTCTQVYNEAVDLETQGRNPPYVSTDPHIEEDGYVHFEYWRWEQAPPHGFEYSMLSDVMYTLWDWVVTFNNHQVSFVVIHDDARWPGQAVKVGVVGVRNVPIFDKGDLYSTS